MKLGDMTVKELVEYCRSTNCETCPFLYSECRFDTLKNEDLNVELIDKTHWVFNGYELSYTCPNCGYEVHMDVASLNWIGCPRCLVKLKVKGR